MDKHRNTLSTLKKMETWRYLRENGQTCPECRGTFILLCFYEANCQVLHDCCRACRKEIEKKEIVKIVMETLKRTGLE